MTDTVTFQNPGLIPMEAVTTMGVSAKEGDNPIGFFGTGLKYAIASLLRTGQKVTIWRGLDRYDFSVKLKEVRGKEFGFIEMRHETEVLDLGFTTHLGARWEMWQVFRELHSNALDEDGRSCIARLEPREDWTTIHVTGTGIADAAALRSTIFLETMPLASLPGLDVHPGVSKSIYYRGVRVGGLNKPSAFTYNITSSVVLTEDRTLKDAWFAHHCVMSALGTCEDERILEPVLTNKDGWEGENRFPSQSTGFSEIALRLGEKHGVLNINSSAIVAAEMWAKQEGRVKKAELSTEDNAEVEKARSFLAAIGYPVEYPIVIADSLGPGIFGMAKKGVIYLARTVVDRGGRFLISTMLEERLHLSHNFLDNSRAFQDFLLDMAVKFASEARRVELPEERDETVAIEKRVDEVEMPF